MSSFISRLGYLNPQFLRECRGRLQPRSIMAAIGLSVLFQLLLCFGVTEGFAVGGREKMLGICKVLASVIPYALFVLGGYYIVDDLTQEAKTGTLNFIRLSPRPAHEILLGKLVGSPILPSLLVLSAMPLFVVSGLLGGLSIWLLVSYFAVVTAGTVAVYIAAILVGLSSGESSLLKQRGVSAISFAGICLVAATPVFMLWNSLVTWQTVPSGSMLFSDWGADSLEWFYLSLRDNSLFSHLFVLGNLAIVSVLLWQIAVRKFRVPQATLLSKKISYIVVAYSNLVGLGFLFSNVLPVYDRGDVLILLYFCDIALFFVLIFALAPTRQALLDWVSYQEMVQGRQRVADLKRQRWRSLLWADGSPSIVAIAINYVIVAAILVTQMNPDVLTGRAIAFTAVCLGLSALTYATVVQLMLSRRLRAPQVWAVGSVVLLAIVPPLVLLSLRLFPDRYAGDGSAGHLWTFLGIPFLGDAATQVPPIVLVGLLGQLCFLGLLLSQLGMVLKRLARQSVV